MSDCCDKNPLQRSGINQQQRLLAGLNPGYIAVDERDYADWIFFAEEFSRYVNYYDNNGTLSGDWNVFFSTDISAILGSIAVQDVEVYRQSVKQRFDFIRDNDNAVNLPLIKQKLNELFSSVLTLSKSLDLYLQKLPDKSIDGVSDFVFKTNLLNLVQTKLAPALHRLLSYYFSVDGVDDNNVADLSEDYLDSSVMTGWKVLNRQVESADVIVWGDGLSSNWWNTSDPDWKTYAKKVAQSPDISVFGPATWLPDVYRRINHAVNHNLFSSIFDQYLQVYTRIVQDAEKTLLVTLGNWNMHPPHYALFLSFLKLFRFSQSHLNTLTKRHLDFYYKEVLRLKPKDAEPNHAHILVELAKPVNQYALTQATELKAGKDSVGKEVLYALDKETTFNKAKVVALKSVYKGSLTGKDDHHQTDNPASIIINNSGRLFASPVANSEDGLGAKLKSPNQEWHPYGSRRVTDGELTDIAMPPAQIGFAMASHYLALAEGERVIRIRLDAGADNYKLYNKAIECYLTTEKGWLKIAADATTALSAIAAGTMSENAVACAEFTINLHGKAPAITNYNAEVHGGTYGVAVPLLKVLLINDELNAYQYEDIKGVSIASTEIKVEVGSMLGYIQTGVKQLLLSNDFGNIDPSKPFMPFGAIPKKDATFVIGSKEIFSKKNAAVKLNIEWAGLPPYSAYIDFGPDPDYYPKVKVNFLSGGNWKGYTEDNTIANEVDIFYYTYPKLTVFSPQSVPAVATVDYSNEYIPNNSKTNSGFLRLVLKNDFGHKSYLTTLTKYLIDQSKTAPTGVPSEPTEPYTPVMQSLYLSYTAYTIHTLSESDKTSFENRGIQFFHICPFGEGEQHAYYSGFDENQFLLPQFTHADTTGTLYHTGEFYIGLENLAAEQSVNILFQLMEGSSDPLVAKPLQHIHWSYLSSNKWLDFDKLEISDATLQLVQSGIISFIIPEKANTANTILPAGYI
ncbi:MAG: hypothetical protein ABL876_07425, partial [Chitinophagaceae bacterium]